MQLQSEGIQFSIEIYFNKRVYAWNEVSAQLFTKNEMNDSDERVFGQYRQRTNQGFKATCNK